VRVVDRHANLKVAARKTRFARLRHERKDHGRVFLDAIALRAEFLGIHDALAHAVRRRFGKELLDADAHLQAAVDRVLVALRAFDLPVALQRVFEELPVRPHAVRRIAGVLLTLQPVAVEHVDRDLANAVGPDEEIPARQCGRGQRAHVREYEAAEFLRGIAGQLLLNRPRRMRLERAFGAGPGLVEEPAVIRTAQAAVVGDAELKIDAPMQAAVADQAEGAAAIAIEDEILTQHAQLADWVLQQLCERRDRNPIAPHQIAARRAGADARQPVVHRRSQHPAWFFRGAA
jgi:hypothetical protein